MTTYYRWLPFLMLALFHVIPVKAGAQWQLVNKELVYLTDVKYTLFLEKNELADSAISPVLLNKKTSEPVVRFTGKDKADAKRLTATITFKQSGQYIITDANQSLAISMRVIPGWLSILPPFAAILLALMFKQVLVALFAGIWLGATFIFGYNPLSGFFNSLTEYIGLAPAQPERTAILIFSLTLGGMVGVISRSGGTQGIVDKLSRYASSSRKGQLATWLMGVIIFFDDYANTLIVGNTMRPLTDKLKISREKLSYLVDSTAAPVANVAIISTWIGYQLSLINESFNNMGIEDNAYITFFQTIPYNFYPLFALVFGLSIASFMRDFGSMSKAEQRALRGQGLLAKDAVPLADVNSSELMAKEGAPLRWYNALVPVFFVIFTTLIGLWYSGVQATNFDSYQNSSMSTIQYISTVIGNADSFAVLMWAAFVGSFIAMIMAIAQRILNLNEAVMAWVSGVKAMVIAALILTMAWAIGNICKDMQTAEYVIALTEDLLSPHLLPTLSFIIAGVIAFSTGTSWGTMAILTPIVIPLAYQLPLADPGITEATARGIFLSSIASILAGSTFGDHCSPISDTTIMSSMASGADHIDHVRTQLPYALTVGGISILIGYLPIGFGFNNLWALLIGVLIIISIVRFIGKRYER
ncbi:MAG: Na+/H+ antiporter NhaC family protein [Caldithrix sp.]|nr:Na+/H+ antiporter NhaC family protein [Caldithrix sp.]